MAFSLIDAAVGYTGSTIGTTASIDTSGASLLVMVGSWYPTFGGGSGNGAGFQDSKSNSWTKLTVSWVVPGGTAIATQIAYVDSVTPTVGSGHTFDVYGIAGGDGNNIYPSAFVSAWSGSVASPFDVENGAISSGAASTLATGSVTPSANDALVIAALGHGSSSGSPSIDGGFTISDSTNNESGHTGGAMAYLIQTSATAANPTWTAADASWVMSAAIAVFGAGGGGGATGQPMAKRAGGVPFVSESMGNKGIGRMWGRRRSGIIVPRRFREAA